MPSQAASSLYTRISRPNFLGQVARANHPSLCDALTMSAAAAAVAAAVAAAAVAAAAAAAAVAAAAAMQTFRAQVRSSSLEDSPYGNLRFTCNTVWGPRAGIIYEILNNYNEFYLNSNEV